MINKKSTSALRGVMQHVKTFAGLVKKNENVPFDTTVSFFGSLMNKETAEADDTAGAKVFKKARAVLDANGSDSDSDGDDEIIEGTVTFPMDYDNIEAPAHYKKPTSFSALDDFADNFSDGDADDEEDEEDDDAEEEEDEEEEEDDEEDDDDEDDA